MTPQQELSMDRNGNTVDPGAPNKVGEVISQRSFSKRSTTHLPIPSSYPTTEGDRIVWVLRDIGDLQLHCTMEMEGRINEERLARAIRLTMDREPILGCYLHERGLSPTWRRRDDLDDVAICTLEQTHDKETAHQRYLRQDLDPAKDPLVQVHILRGDTDTVIIKLSHLTADAAATKQYAYMLAAHYRELATQPNLQVTPLLTSSRSMIQVLEHFTWKQIFESLRGWIRDTWRMFFPMQYWNVPTLNGPREQHRYTLRHIAPPQFQAMKVFARQHNATMNDLIVAAYFRTLHSMFGTHEWGPHRMQNTVDIRRYLPQPPERLFNLSNFVYPHFRQPLGDTLSDTVALVRDQMNHFKRNMIGTGELVPAGLLLNVLPAKVTRLMIRYLVPLIKKVLPPTLTNMGRIFPDQLDFGLPISNAFLTASIIYPPFYGGGFSGFGENITFSGGYCATGFANPHQIDELLDAVVDELNVGAE